MDGFIKLRNSFYLLKNVQKPVSGVGFFPYGEGSPFNGFGGSRFGPTEFEDITVI